MSAILTLDLSKRSTGWCLWAPGWESPRFASVQLGSEYTSDGRCCMKLHQVLADLHAIEPFEHLYFEQPLTIMQRGGASSVNSDILLKLAGHAESFGEAYRLRTVMGVHIASWRRHYIGAMPRGTQSKELKDYTIERCRQLGFKPQNTDQADAIGLMDYACELRGITPPWRCNEVLRPPLAKAR